MKTSRLHQIVSILVALLFIQACSHPIEIEGQGDVTSASGDRNCSLEQFTAADPVCSKNYVIGAYQETYYAKARAGWQFDHWVTYCTTAAPPNYECSFNTPAEQVGKFWGQTMPSLKAVFTPIPAVDTDGDGLNDDVDPCPANPTNPCKVIADTDTVKSISPVYDKEWAQPDLFTNLSWNDINAACPVSEGGVCRFDATLNEYDVSGWTWGTVADVNGLINVYIAPMEFGTAPQGIAEVNSLWGPVFFTPATGFRSLSSLVDGTRFIDAWIAQSDGYFGYLGRFKDQSDVTLPDSMSTAWAAAVTQTEDDMAAFLYR
jgi:hypothetical protein